MSPLHRVYLCLGGEDYDPTPLPATLTLVNILPSLRACTLIAIENDLDVEGDEEFLVSLEPSSIFGMFTFTPNQTRVRILDTDVQGKLHRIYNHVSYCIHMHHGLFTHPLSNACQLLSNYFNNYIGDTLDIAHKPSVSRV